MKRKSTGSYPENWSDIARRCKNEAGWHCVRCGEKHDPLNGYCLTVHHLDLDPSNCAWWNLAALCQRCHLSVQGRVVIQQGWMFLFSNWIRPYVAGYYASINGLPTDKIWVMDHINELLKIPFAERLQIGTVTARNAP